MKKNRYIVIFILLFFLNQLMANIKFPDGYQYIFPHPGAQYIHHTTTIIVRLKNIFPKDLINLSEMISVTGDKSGQHYGNTIVASDNRTIIFKSARLFDPGEIVRVSIKPYLAIKNGKEIKSLEYEFSVLSGMVSQSKQISKEKSDSALPKISETKNQPIIMSNGVSVPSDFPHVNISLFDNPFNDYVFLNNWGPPNYNIIFDVNGNPVWYLKTTDRRRDFKVQSNGWITMLIRDGYGGSGEGYIAFDENFEFIKSMRTTNGYTTDEHEHYMLPDSGYFLIGRRETIVDMSLIVPGGLTNAIVRETCIQEFTADDQMIFIWRAWDHFDIRDMELEDLTSNYIRFPHMNAIFIDDDGHILLSSRHLSEISKIHRQNSSFIWRMSGIPSSPNNDFEFINDPLSGFRNQHAIRSLGDNHYLIFDNGNLHSPPTSRAVEYAIDTLQMKATLVWEFRNDVPNHYSYYMGNAQRLPNGNTHINWAVGHTLPVAQEITPSGTKAFELQFADGYHCYRSFRHPWEGNVIRPYLILEQQPDNLTLIFNKFGDDSVNYYNIYGGTSPGSTTLIDTSRQTLKKLENLVNGQRYYFRVTAVNHNGIESDFSNEEDIVVNIVQPGTNLILNNDFTNGLDSWIWELQGSASGQAQIENGICHIIIQNAGTNIYDVQLRQNGIPLIHGEKYTFEFDAWADQIRAAEIKVGQDEYPYTNYSRIGYCALSTTSKHFSYTFEMQESTDNNARVVINAGIYSPDIYIDNLSLIMNPETTIGEHKEDVTQITGFMLYQNQPNPFNPVTKIKFKLENTGFVTVKIYDIHGKEIHTLVNRTLMQGDHSYNWNATGYASGVYYYRIVANSSKKAGEYIATRKMILLK